MNGDGRIRTGLENISEGIGNGRPQSNRPNKRVAPVKAQPFLIGGANLEKETVFMC